MRRYLTMHLLVFATFFLFFAIFAPMGHIPSDTEHSVLAASALVNHGTLAITDTPERLDLVRGREGNYYSKYGVGYALLFVPVVAAANLLALLTHSNSGMALQALLSFVNTGIAALIIVVCMSIFMKLGYAPRIALVAASLIAGASILLPYSKIVHAELPTALILICFLRTIIDRCTLDFRMGCSIGMTIALLMLFKPGNICYAAVIFMYGIWLGLRHGRSRLGALAFLLLPCAFGILIASINWLRFGNILDFGYGDEQQRFTTPFILGLAGLIFSPSKSLFVFSPLVILCGAVYVRMLKKQPRFSLLIGTLFGAALVLNARWHGWDGGWSWGPRLIVPAIIIFHLLIPEYCLLCIKNRMRQVLLVVLVAAGFLINGTGALVWYQQVYYFHKDHWSLKNSHPVIAGKLLIHKLQGKPEVYAHSDFAVTTSSFVNLQHVSLKVDTATIDFSGFEKFRGLATMWDGLRNNFGLRFTWLVPLLLAGGALAGWMRLWRKCSPAEKTILP